MKMQSKELAVVVSNGNVNVSVLDTIDAIVKVGFKKVFIQWYNNKNWEGIVDEHLIPLYVNFL